MMLKILQITDLHVTPHSGDTMLGIDTEHYFKKTLDYAYSQHGPFDLILLTGDLAQDPCPDSYQRIHRHLAAYETLCLCLPGNHDDFTLMKQYLNSDKVSCEKHLLLGNWQIIALNSQIIDSPCGELKSEELDYLKQCLHSHPGIPTVIALHHHCLASGSKWLDTMQIRNSAAFLALLKHYPQIKAVAYGHIHQEFYRLENQVALLASPASCFQFTPNSSEFSIADEPPGYRVLQLFDDHSLQSACYRVPINMDQLNRKALQY